jgi:hypothetical protein
MTPEEAYKNYYRFCRDTETWTPDFIKNNLKRTGADYEEYNFQEFKDKLLTDDRFNKRWANGCTRILTTQERKDLYDKINHTKDIFPTDENGWNKLFDEYNIPTRIIK